MNGRRVMVAFAFLCALAFSAFAAPGASAETKGTTAFTCVPEPNPTKTTKGFKDAHCTPAEAVTGTEAKFIHKEIKQDETTFFHANNEKTKNKTTESTPFTLKGVLGGIAIEITCAKVTSHGKLTNKLDPTGEHWVHGQEITIHYTECAIKGAVFAGCKFKENTIMVEKVTETTTGEGDNVRFKPEEGDTFVNLIFESCNEKAFNGEHPVKGSVRGQPNGATINFTHKTITEEKTLTFGGQPAGLEGSLTVSQAEATEESAKTGNPISVTTVTTP